MMDLTSLRIVVCLVLYVVIIKTYECKEFSVRVTKHGRVKGIVEIVHGQKKVEKFFGIPYASPPVGNLRFEVSLFFHSLFSNTRLCMLHMSY